MIAQQNPNIFSMSLTFFAILFTSGIIIKILSSVFKEDIDNDQKMD